MRLHIVCNTLCIIPHDWMAQWGKAQSDMVLYSTRAGASAGKMCVLESWHAGAPTSLGKKPPSPQAYIHFSLRLSTVISFNLSTVLFLLYQSYLSYLINWTVVVGLASFICFNSDTHDFLYLSTVISFQLQLYFSHYINCISLNL